LHHDNALSHTSFFTRGFFLTKNNMTRPPPTLLFSLSPIEEKIDTIEVIETEPQAVLNTLTEHDFQDAFKNGRSTGNSAYSWKGTTFRVMVTSRPKVSF
jgi:hypothetical protein